MFVVVAEERNFTKAARRLFMTQPALSAAMNRMEAAVGQQLCTRTSRAVGLTPAGTVLLAHAMDILRSVSALEDDLRPERAMVRAAMSTGPAGVPLELLEDMRRRHPDIHVDVIPLPPTEHVAALRDGHVDVFFGGRPRALDRSNQVSELVRLEAILMAIRPSRGGHRTASCGPMIVDDPVTGTFPMWAELTSSYAVAAGIAAVVRPDRGAPVHVMAQTVGLDEILPIFSSTAPQYTANGMQVCRPAPLQPYFTWWMTWQEPRGRGRRDAVAAFVDCARTLAAERNWRRADDNLPGTPWLSPTASQLVKLDPYWTAASSRSTRTARSGPYPVLTLGTGSESKD